MRKGTKIILSALAATVFLSLAVSTASANHLELRFPEKGFRLWGVLDFGNTFGGATVNCPVTVEGTWHLRTIEKVSGKLVGYITRAIIGGGGTEPPCTGGRATVLRETLPWHVRYLSYTGTLPTIETIKLATIGAAFRVSSSFGICLTRSSAEHPIISTTLFFAERGGVWRNSNNEGTVEGEGLPIGGEFLCDFAAGRLTGSRVSASVLGEVEPIQVRLI